MTLRQLLLLREISRQALNMSRAAEALFMSQPAISRQIQLLEEELGIPLLMRRRNRTLGFTVAGREILAAAERALGEVDAIRGMAADAKDEERGQLRLITTHLHARHTLLEPMARFMRTHPQIPVQLLAVSDPETIPEALARGEAELGVSTERGFERTDVTMLRGAALRRSLIFPSGHALERKRRIGIADIASYPMLGFGTASRSSQLMEETLKAATGVAELNVLARVANTDVVKAYVAKGLGIAVIPTIAFEPDRDVGIASRDVTRLFPESYVAVSFRKSRYLRRHVRDFIELVLPGRGPAAHVPG